MSALETAFLAMLYAAPGFGLLAVLAGIAEVIEWMYGGRK